MDITREFYIESFLGATVVQNQEPKNFIEKGKNAFNVLVVNSGKLLVTVGKNIYECPQGTAVILPSESMHYAKLISGVYSEYTVISFSANGVLCNDIIAKAVSLSVFEKQLLLDINNQILAFADFGESLSLNTKIDSIHKAKLISSTELLAVNIFASNNVLKPIESRDSLLFETAIEKLKENIFGNVSVEDLAKELGISLSHIKRIFAAFCDVGVHEYYMGLKILKAKEMLKDGNSVTETAEIMGFNNQNYFSQAFKRMTGISPKEYSGSKRKVVTKTVVAKSEPKPKTEPKRDRDMPNYLL